MATVLVQIRILWFSQIIPQRVKTVDRKFFPPNLLLTRENI
jgi:hypothetical protein